MNSGIKKNIFYNTGYRFLAILFPLITSPYLSRVLGIDGVGIYAYTYSVADYFVLFAMLGISNYGSRSIAFVKDNQQKRSQMFWSIYLMQLIWGGVVFGLYVLYIVWIKPNNYDIALMQGIYVASAMLDINWFFFGMEKYKLTVIRNMFIKLITLMCIFVFVRNENDILKYTVIMAAGMFISQSFVWVYLFRYIKFVRIKISSILAHIKPNLILFVPVIAHSIYKIMDKIMLGNIATYSSVGIYEYAEKIVNIPYGFIAALGTVMMTRISYLTANHQDEKVREYMLLSIEYISITIFPIVFGLIGVGPTFLKLYYGEAFIESGYVIRLLAPTIIFVAWASIIRTQYLIPYKKDKIYLLSTVVGASLNLIINMIMIPSYGVYGAAIGTIVAELSVVIVQIIYIKDEFEHTNIINKILPSLFMSTLMCGIVVLIRKVVYSDFISLIVMICAGAISYFTMIYIYYVLIKKDTLISSVFDHIGAR